MKFIGKACSNWLTLERPPNKFPICDFERIRYEVRPCDVLLVEGRSRASEVIKAITQSSWSHAALYIGRMHDIEDLQLRKLAGKHFEGTPDAQLIIEGVMGKGTIITPMANYSSDHMRICRPRGLSPDDAQKVIGQAICKLGFDYDVRHVLDLARFLLPWAIMPRRWRSRVFSQQAGSATRTVCSTMIAEAFAHVDFPILPYVNKDKIRGYELIRRNPRLFTPRDFDYSPYFEIIKYPFISFDTHAMYRQLPWNRDESVHNDHAIQNNIYTKETPKQKKTKSKSKSKPKKSPFRDFIKPFSKKTKKPENLKNPKKKYPDK